MRFLRFLLLLATVWSARPSVAQQPEGITGPPPPNAAPRHTLSGNVMNSVTAEPIRKALVTIQSSQGELSTFSDTSGHYEFPNITDRQIPGSCRKPGFVDQLNLRLNNSSSRDSIIRLTPYSSISGRVVDEDGAPIEGALVQAITATVENGRRIPTPGPLDRSDGSGHFEIDSLAAGDYRLALRTSNLPPFQRASPTEQASRPTEMYAPQYLGGGLDLSSAQVIHLLPGQSQEADFTVKIAPSHLVTGSTSPSSSASNLVVEDSEGNDFSVNVRLNTQTGRWAINGLPTGTWKISMQSFDGHQSLYGEQTITVADKDLTDIGLTLTQQPQIPVLIKGVTDDTSNPVDLTLQDATLAIHRSRLNTFMQDSHSLTALPGRYFLQARPNQSYCIEDVHVDGVDLNRDGLIVQANGGGAPINVVVRNDCASLDVQFNNADETKMATVLVLGSNFAFTNAAVAGSQNGTIHLENLAPGDYHVYAFDTVDDLEWTNPDIMQNYASTSVSLNPSSKSSVKLDVNVLAKSTGSER